MCKSSIINCQVISRISIIHQLPALAKSLVPLDSQSAEMYTHMDKPRKSPRYVLCFNDLLHNFFRVHNAGDKVEVTGKPHCGTLTPFELSLFSGTVNGENVMFYSGLMLSDDTIVTAKSRSQARKRDNPVVLYSGVHYGVIEKIFTFGDIYAPYCLVSLLVPTVSICTDDVTHANIESLDSM